MLKLVAVLLFVGSFSTQTNYLDNLRSDVLPTRESARKLSSSLTSGYQVYIDEGIGKYKNYSFPIKNDLSLEFSIVRTTENYSDFNPKMSQVVAKVHNGYLVGFDGGEFGGSLYWFDEKRETNYRILKGNIKDILVHDNSIIVTDGLNHRSLDVGKVFNLIFDEGKWQAKKIVELNEAIYTAQLSSEKDIIIITSESIFKINSTYEVTQLVSNGFWEEMHPNSSIAINDVIYFGTYKGVVKYNLMSSKLEWLVEN